MTTGFATGGQHMRLLCPQSCYPAADRFALSDRVVRQRRIGAGLVENTLGQPPSVGVIPVGFLDGGRHRGRLGAAGEQLMGTAQGRQLVSAHCCSPSLIAASTPVSSARSANARTL